MSDSYLVTLKSSKHKRKAYRHMILASDDTDSNTKVLKYRPNLVILLCVILAIILGAFVGLVYFEGQRDVVYEGRLAEKDAQIAQLTEANAELDSEISSLNDKIQILSDTVATKTANETQLSETLEAQSIPSEFPLTGGASFSEVYEPEPACVFTVSNGITVVATASGKVADIYEDEEYGNVIVIDHENGYKTIYKNEGSVTVHLGDSVSQGTTLYVIDSDNTTLIYQISKDDIMIDPLNVLEIAG